MIALFVTVLTASLLGSLHCAGMCGPFCCVAVCSGCREQPSIFLHVAYHGGRLMTYTLLGIAAGSLGALLNLASTLAGIQPLALALAGGMLVICGLIEIAKLKGWTGFGLLANLKIPKFWLALMQRGQQFAARRSALPRALIIGLLTTLLPCGWLYAFVITAAGSGGAIQGGVVMAAFWLGTVPVLLSLGLTAKRLAGALGEKLPMLTAVTLIFVGLLTLSGRLTISAQALAEDVSTEAELRGEAVPDPNELPPCCRARKASADQEQPAGGLDANQAEVDQKHGQ